MQAVIERHDGIFENDRNEPQEKVFRKANVARERRLQFLPVDVQLHKMPHLRDDLGERVVAERGVDIRADGGNEVSQRLAREPAAQIDGDGQRHGAQAVGLFALLLFQNDVNEHSGEVFGDRRVVLFRLLAQLRERHEAHRHMERVKRLACAGILIRRRLAVEAQCVMSCVAA